MNVADVVMNDAATSLIDDGIRETQWMLMKASAIYVLGRYVVMLFR